MRFETDILVTVGDVNYGGHVGNDRFLLFFHEARIRFLSSLGRSELDIGGGQGMIMSEARVKYKAQVMMGDALVVSITTCEIRSARFSLLYEISNKESGQIVAEGRTFMSAFDYERNRVARLPVEFAGQLASYEIDLS